MNFKKEKIIVLSILLMFLLSGCDNKSDYSNNELSSSKSDGNDTKYYSQKIQEQEVETDSIELTTVIKEKNEAIKKDSENTTTNESTHKEENEDEVSIRLKEKLESTSRIETLTEDEVCAGISNYIKQVYDYEGDIPCYWSVLEKNDNEIVIDFRSYTAAHIYYYVDVCTGDVHTMEWVPGISDEKVPGTEKFNIKKYIN